MLMKETGRCANAKHSMLMEEANKCANAKQIMLMKESGRLANDFAKAKNQDFVHSSSSRS